MKFSILTGAALCLTVLLIGCTQGVSACEKPLVIATTEQAPYNETGADGARVGLDAELLREISKRSGCQFDVRVMTWKRVQQMVRFGAVDGATSASRTPERETYAHFSRPYRRESMVMFMRSGDVAGFDAVILDDLVKSPHNIGVELGAWNGEAFLGHYQTNSAFRQRILQTPEYGDLVRWLLAGRIDIAVLDLMTGAHMAREHDALEQLSIHPMPINDDYIHLMFSRLTVQEADVARISAAIKEFQATEAYAQLLRRYVPVNYLQHLRLQ